MRNQFGATATAAVVLLFATTNARGDDWPSQGLNAARLRATTERSGARFRAQSWTYAVPGALWSTSSPAVADGILVFGTRDGTIHGLRASTGRLLWQFKAGDGILASPAIHKGRVFVPSLDNKLYALRLSDGVVVWSKDLGGLDQSSPTIIEDSVVVAAGYPTRKLFRVDTLTGTTIWETSSDDMAQFSNSAAASDGQQVIIGAQQGHLYSFDLATGAHRWTYEADGIVNLAAPLIVGDRVYLLPGGDSGRIHAVDAATGQAVSGWPIDLPLVTTNTAIAGKMLNRAYAVSSLAWVSDRLVFDVRIDDSMDTDKDAIPDQFVMREFVMALRPSDGQVLWQIANGKGTLDSTNDIPKNWLCPTPVGYQGTAAGTQLVAVASTLSPTLLTLDVASGTTRGTIALSAPSRVSPVLANGRLFIGTEGGTLHANLSSANQPPSAPVLAGSPDLPIPSTSAVVRWAAAFDPEGDAVSYLVRVDHDREILENWETEITTAAGETSVHLSKPLQAGLTYTFAVRARDSKGAWSDWSAPQFAEAVAMPDISVGGRLQPSLAGALATASLGGVIKLGAGRFYLTETLRVPPGVSLQGAGPQQTILDATGQATGISLDGSVEGHPTEVKGLTVTGAQTGIAVQDSRDARIKNVIVRDNRDAAIEISAAGSATITNTTLLVNGLGVRSFGLATVKNSIVTGNQTGFFSGHADAVISKFNDVYGNSVAYNGMARGANDLSREVTFTDYAKRDLHVARGQASTDQGDPTDDFAQEPAPNGSRVNLGAFGGTAEAELSGTPPPPAPGPGPTASVGGCAVAGDVRGAPSRGWLAFGLIAAILVVRRRRVRHGRMLVTGLVVLAACFCARPVWAAACVWKPTSGTTNWDATPASTYWTCGHTPISSDDVTFNTAGTCTLNVAVNVTSITISSGAGTINGGSSDIIVSGDFNLSSGTFKASTGNFNVGGNFNKTGGTFTHNSGTTMLNGTSGTKTFASNGATFNNLTISDGLVGYWKLDEASGTTSADSSGYGNTGTQANTPTVDTSNPAAIKFADANSLRFANASHQSVLTASLPTELKPSVLTISAWYKSGSLGGDIISGSNRYVLRIDASAAYLIKQTASGTWAFATYTHSVLDGLWHHIAGTISGTTATLYFDGASVATTADSTAIYYSGSTALGIGKNTTGTGQDFQGNIDDVRVYNRVLSAADIAVLAAGSQQATTVTTYNLSGNPFILGDLTIGSGTLAGSNSSIDVAGNWWNYGGVFTTGTTGTVTFSGSTSGKTILAAGSDFNNLTISGTGAWTVSDTDALMVDKNFSQSAGTFTTAATLFEVDGSFNQTAGTFNQTAGRTLLDSPGNQVFGASGTTTFNNLYLNDGLMGYWKLDDSAVGTAVDSSGHGNDGTHLNTPTIASAPTTPVNFNDPYALQYTMASRHAVQVTPMPASLEPSAVTISAWYKATTTDGGHSDLVSAGDSYVLRITSTQVQLVKRYAGAWVTVASTPASAAHLSGGWHHLAGTISSAGMVLYYDGASVGTDVTANGMAAIVYDLGTDFFIGRHGNGSTSFDFDGTVDEVRVYNRALNASEIYSLYLGNQPGSYAAIHTLSGDATISGDMVIASGKLSAASSALTVGGSWWNYGGVYSTSTGSVTFNGSAATNKIRAAGSIFGNVIFNGSGTWTLAEKMETDPAKTVTTTAGTFNLSSYTLRTGDINRNGGVTITPSTGTVVLDASASVAALDVGTLYNVRIEPVAATSLVGYWKLDEGQGTTLRDFSGKGNTGTLINTPTWVTSGLPSIGFYNPAAISLDGVSDYVTLGTTNLPNINGNMTVAFWMYYASVPSTSQDAITLKSSTGYLQIGFLNAGGIKAWGNTGTVRVAATSTPASGWHHIAYTWDGTTHKLYVDGGTPASAGTARDTGAVTAAYLGSWIGSGEFFAGKLDDVRIYNAVLTSTQVAALAAGKYPAGLSGTPTYTLGYATAPTGTFNLDNGTLDTSTYNMSVTGAASVNSGTYTVGTSPSTSTFTGGLTVGGYGTLGMASTGTVSMGSGSTLIIDGTLNASNTSTTIQSASGNYTFTVGSSSTATPTLNITGLQVKNPNASGMNINVDHSASTTFTRFDNIAFSGGPTTPSTATLLKIYAPSLYLVSNGCSFTHTSATKNVTLVGDTDSTTETRAYFGNATCSPTTCETYDSDDDNETTPNGVGDNMATNGSVIQWVKAAMADTSGTIEGFPTSAFDWNLFTYYSTYVVYHDVGGGTADRIYLRDTNGNPKSATSYWDTPSGVNIIGTPRYDTTAVTFIHYVYVATSTGQIYRLIDDTTAKTLTQDNTGNWAGANNPYDCSCTITTPLTVDANNIYWAGTASGNKVWTLGKTSRALAASSPYAAPAVISGAAPTVWTSANSHVQMFMGSTDNFYKVDINAQTLTDTHAITASSGTVNGRISIINSKVYGADNRGKLWVLDPENFATATPALWSYHDDGNHNGCTAGTGCAVTSSLYVDFLLNRAFFGDSDGHLYAAYNSTGTTGAQATGWPYYTTVVADVFASAPFYNAGIVVAGSTIGNLYIIDVNGGSGPVLKQTYKFGTALIPTTISGVGYDRGSSSYMVSISNATNKDGKLIYIDAFTDTTPGSN